MRGTLFRIGNQIANVFIVWIGKALLQSYSLPRQSCSERPFLKWQPCCPSEPTMRHGYEKGEAAAHLSMGEDHPCELIDEMEKLTTR